MFSGERHPYIFQYTGMEDSTKAIREADYALYPRFIKSLLDIDANSFDESVIKGRNLVIFLSICLNENYI